jgi:hypothetical protein
LSIVTQDAIIYPNVKTDNANSSEYSFYCLQSDIACLVWNKSKNIWEGLDEFINMEEFSHPLQQLLSISRLKTWCDFLELDPAMVVELGKFGLKT